MSRPFLSVVAIFLITADTGFGHTRRTGDPGDGGSPDRHPIAWPAADPAPELQYRAALLHLRSEGARRVVQLQRCPGAGDVTDGLLREARLERLGGPLVVGRGTDWARLDRWRKEAGEDVAVLVQDGDLLAEALKQSQASWWREAFWYAPGMEQSDVLEKLGFAHKFKILTTKVVDGSKRNWTVPLEEDSSQTAGKDFNMKTKDIGGFNISSKEQPSSITDFQWNSDHRDTAVTSPSAIVLRWAPLAPPSQSPLLQVLRASPWLLAGVCHSDHPAIESPTALLVQRSVLSSQLSAAGCATWRAELSGADPLSGELLSLRYTSDTLPAVVTLQGGGPLRVTVRCPDLGATLRCGVDLERQSCHWDGRASSRRRRAAGQSYGREQSAGWRPAQWAGRRDQHRTGKTIQPAATESSQHQLSVRLQEAASQPWKEAQSNPHRSGVASAEYSDAAYQQYSDAAYQPYSDDTYPGDYSDATYPAEYRSDTYSEYSGDTYPAVHDGYSQRRRDSPERRMKMLTEDIRLAVWPSFSSCGGAIAGCMTCVTLLTVLDVGVTPAACIGPCSIGGGSACTGAVGTLYREVRKAQIAMARKRRRELSARSQRRLGRFRDNRRPQRHL